MTRPAVGTALCLALLLGACGYFNSLYNARRAFQQGERAAREGNSVEASRAFRDAVARAAVSYRGHPAGRWSDDALLLIGRAHFALGEHHAARAALGRALEQGRDQDVRTDAALYLGASFVRLAHPDSALAPLDQALAGAERGSVTEALARLWLGRARLDLEQTAGWSDLEAVAAGTGQLGQEARLELAARGLAADDSAHTLGPIRSLLADRAAEARLDSILALARGARAAWGPAPVTAMLPADVGRQWQPEARTRIRFARAALLAEAGDTAAAITAGLAAAGLSAGEHSGQAREAVARWLLARADGVADLDRVREVLLPAVTHAGALQQVRRVRTLDVLLDRARAGQAAALFAAAEYSRDSLASPGLARQFFLAYAEVAAVTVWAPKALLAALPLTNGAERPELERRILQHADNPYVAALQGRADPDAFYQAEERLGRAVGALREDAAAAALSGDLRVGRAVAVLDSLRMLARADTVRLRCGTLLDSLALRGIRADSVRAACLRSDTAGVTRYLALDTLQLRDSVATGVARPRVGRDTLSAP